MGRSSDAKERLILTALRLVQARSYTTVSVDELCHEAQINKGSFYYFFPSTGCSYHNPGAAGLL